MKKTTLYFLCTGNSCRSQIAEGFAKHYGGEDFEVYSAGLETHGLNPRAVATMNEIGIDISHHTSDLIDPALLNRADYVITLCGHAADNCPVIPPHVQHLHWGFDDPAKGGDEAKFREVRDAIGERIKSFINEQKNRA
ncbi:MAG: arsenate reductase (thioredoxin) [Tumebacillaceae bacterium]